MFTNIHTFPIFSPLIVAMDPAAEPSVSRIWQTNVGNKRRTFHRMQKIIQASLVRQARLRLWVIMPLRLTRYCGVQTVLLPIQIRNKKQIHIQRSPQQSGSLLHVMDWGIREASHLSISSKWHRERIRTLIHGERSWKCGEQQTSREAHVRQKVVQRPWRSYLAGWVSRSSGGFNELVFITRFHLLSPKPVY